MDDAEGVPFPAVAPVADFARRFADLWSRAYDVPVVQRLVYRPVHDAVLDELRRQPTRRVLDVGCGTGILSTRIADELDAESVTGCDFSLGMLGQASARGAGPWVQGDAQRLPIVSESVDAVVSTESFHWFPDPDVALAEFRRVLAPAGRVVMGMVNIRTDVGARALKGISNATGQPIHVETWAELSGRLGRAGFGDIRRRRIARMGSFALPSVLTVATRND